MFEFQVLCPDPCRDNPSRWVSVRPTGGQPYQYNTREEAESMMRMCYHPPEFGHLTRVINLTG